MFRIRGSQAVTADLAGVMITWHRVSCFASLRISYKQFEGALPCDLSAVQKKKWKEEEKTLMKTVARL